MTQRNKVGRLNERILFCGLFLILFVSFVVSSNIEHNRGLRGEDSCRRKSLNGVDDGDDGKRICEQDNLQPESPLYVFSLKYVEQLSPQDAYEHTHLVAALQGIANRNEPRLYVISSDEIDGMWLQYLEKKEPTFFQNRTIIEVTDLERLVGELSDVFHGVVLYDPNVYATSMIASTIAGVEELLPICYRPNNEKVKRGIPHSFLGQNTTSSKFLGISNEYHDLLQKNNNFPENSKSLYNRLVASGPKLVVKKSLYQMFTGNITGSSKCDAYIWAKEQYLDSGRCNPSIMAYYLDYFWTTVASHPYDRNTVINHDYFISKRAFFWDLDVWDDEAPNDDPHQPLGTDLRTLQQVLHSSYEQIMKRSEFTDKMIHVGGFTPWAFKYVGQKHDGVQTEWQTVQILTSYNAFIDADACCIGSMANAAIFQHFKLKERYIQQAAPTKDMFIERGYLDPSGKTVVRKTYFYFYVGDYDSTAWLYSQLKSKWDDPSRGQVPLGWAINPNLSLRFPIIFPYLYSTLTNNDYITTGDSGAGYVNPTQILEPRKFSNLPSAKEAWIKHNIAYYRRFNLKYTGFLINGLAGHLTDDSEKMYTSFSYDGMMTQYGYEPPGKNHTHLQSNTPIFQNYVDLPSDPSKAAQIISSFHKDDQTQFLVFRSILQSPSYFKQILEILSTSSPNMVAMTPQSMSYLARVYLGGSNDNRITYTNDTIPRTMKSSQEYENLRIEVRNEGWNVIAYKSVHMKISLLNETVASWKTEYDINSGNTGVFVGNIVAPDFTGYIKLSYELCFNDGSRFSEFGNLPWESEIYVSKATKM